MTFLSHWLLYLVAFGLGALVMFFVVARLIPAASEHEAFADLDDAGYDERYDVDDTDLDGDRA